MSLKLEAIWRDQGDISELLVSPDLPQIGEGVFLEILSGQKHFSYVSHHLLNSGTSAEWVSPFVQGGRCIPVDVFMIEEVHIVSRAELCLS